jgi:arylsulfatase A
MATQFLSNTSPLKRLEVAFTSLFTLICFSGCSDSRDVEDRPNIVFILADDLGWHQLGAYGSTFYETPHIDALSASGMRFTDAYMGSSICSPARASIMTGKYPARLHLTDFIKGRSPEFTKLKTPDWTPYLPLSEVTIPEVLAKAGYVSGHFGKWHLNKDKEYQLGRPMDPGSQGFSDVLTTTKPSDPKAPNQDDWHHVREITDRALAFIEANRNSPFFCYVTHNSIHRPEMEDDALIDKYRAKPEADNDEEYGHNNPIQAAMLETLDKSVGKIVSRLDELGLSENTLVIFVSDNGHLGPKDSRPLRGSKADLYEGGIRVPLIAQWKGKIEAGSECSSPVVSCDFLPTFAEVANLDGDAPLMDGVSLIPLLLRGDEIEREALYWHFPHYHHQGIAPSGAVRVGDFKLI